MKIRNLFILITVAIIVVMCTPEPVETKPVYFNGVMVSEGIN